MGKTMTVEEDVDMMNAFIAEATQVIDRMTAGTLTDQDRERVTRFVNYREAHIFMADTTGISPEASVEFLSAPPEVQDVIILALQRLGMDENCDHQPEFQQGSLCRLCGRDRDFLDA